ncbi:LLM class flavin-dependent oxidoreductase [Neobacillus mesonae]|uniref:LLM class flavin-dependent oxidoreductase n=1 Tax=Neobacillus mesonae TaxID=1193713 RepID=UPI00083715D6|nr:LLM class flavin-dependent oxidoreductase [Neobacillus mesonae]
MKKESGEEPSGIEIGVYTLADLEPDPHTDKTISARQRLEEIIEAAKIADAAGLDVFGVGEHHRLDYAVSAPSVVLAAISQVTKRIKLTSATTILNTVDPVRLFEEFATLDLLSKGRAEIMAGRGAFKESFPLFGFDVKDDHQLFEENLALLMKLNEQEKISWKGRYRAALQEAEIAPRPMQKSLPIWVGVGGSLESAKRAGRLGAGLALAILGGEPKGYKPLVAAYREAGKHAGYAAFDLKVAVTGHAFIGKTTEEAKDQFYPYHANYWEYLNRQQGRTRQISRAEFDRVAEPDTSLFVGNSQDIIEKILKQYELFGHQRFMAQMDIGGMPFKYVAQNIERLAVEIAPIVRRETKK